MRVRRSGNEKPKARAQRPSQHWLPAHLLVRECDGNSTGGRPTVSLGPHTESQELTWFQTFCLVLILVCFPTTYGQREPEASVAAGTEEWEWPWAGGHVCHILLTLQTFCQEVGLASMSLNCTIFKSSSHVTPQGYSFSSLTAQMLSLGLNCTLHALTSHPGKECVNSRRVTRVHGATVWDLRATLQELMIAYLLFISQRDVYLHHPICFSKYV